MTFLRSMRECVMNLSTFYKIIILQTLQAPLNIAPIPTKPHSRRQTKAPTNPHNSKSGNSVEVWEKTAKLLLFYDDLTKTADIDFKN